ncbi:MAG: prenyltransferase, partial [Chloroflexi bacterium]|nr:prenyltransferase [Chloroflexota bacterium]NOH14756.1 prenyltransferase [Chloroflexota bacterium]
GLLHPRTALWSAFIALGLSVLGLLWLNALGAVNVGTLVLFGLLVLAAVAYSAPPFMLVQRGLGEVDVTLVFALLVPLFAHNLQTGQLSLVLALTCLPFAALIFAMMLLVGIPDYEADRAAGKGTLVVRIGPERAARWYVVALLLGFISPWLTLGWGLPLEVLLLQMLAAPMVYFSLRSLHGQTYLDPANYLRNLRLGAGALLTIGVIQIIGFLIA